MADEGDSNGENTDHEEETEVTLSKAVITKGLSDVERATNRKDYAYVRLALQGMQLKTLEGDLRNYKELRYVNFANNQITDMSPLRALPNLLSINTQHNTITEFSNLGSQLDLQLLELDANSISSFEKFKYASVVALSISRNKITGFGGLKIEDSALEILDLSFNAVDNLVGIGALSKLRMLNLKNNLIKDVEGIAGCAHLERIDLSGNQLKSIQELKKLQGLPKLTHLVVTGNADLYEGMDDPDDLMAEALILLPRLTFLDSRQVTLADRTAADLLHKDRLAEQAAKAAAEAEAAAEEAALKAEEEAEAAGEAAENTPPAGDEGDAQDEAAMPDEGDGERRED